MTGYFRDGLCNTDASDRGLHVVCSVVTQRFLDFTKSKGNDLSTPRFSFPGLKPGDGWCLCAIRWKEAYEAGAAPNVKAKSTHMKALEIIPKEILLEYSVDVNSTSPIR